MKKEDFLKIGLTDEQAEKAAAAWEKELEGYVAKGEYDTKVNELETANNSIKDLTGKLKDFDGVDVEGLKIQKTLRHFWIWTKSSLKRTALLKALTLKGLKRATAIFSI